MVFQFQIGTMRNFVYLIVHDGEAYVVDPQSDLTPWEKKLEELGAKIKGVLLTHSHHDHVAGVPGVTAKYGVPIYVHPLERHRLKKGGAEVQAKVREIQEGEKLALGGSSVEVWHTPGHSAGECCFLWRVNTPWELFTGDTVFVREVGRTDLETGSTAELFETLQRLKKLPGETVVYPGHNYGLTPTSTIAEESKSSAAFLCKTVEELERLP